MTTTPPTPPSDPPADSPEDRAAGPEADERALRSVEPVLDPDGLPESRLSTFIDAGREHALYFLEGQRLVRDLALIHGAAPRAFAFFRDVVLSAQPLIALIKGGEQLGFYVDSDEPLFRFKLETTHGGDTRCTIVPEELEAFPDVMSGVVRVETRYPTRRPPYLSILEVDRLPLEAVINRVLRDSYQVKCAVAVSPVSDQSVMLHRLPPLPTDDPALFTVDAVQRRLAQLRPRLDELFARGTTSDETIVEALTDLGFRRISSRPVRFRCACSRERLLASLRMVPDRSELFGPGEDSLEAACDYCKTRYEVTRAELDAPPEERH